MSRRRHKHTPTAEETAHREAATAGGRKLHELRTSRSMSRQDLAEALEITRPELITLEDGLDRITDELVGRIKVALKLTGQETGDLRAAIARADQPVVVSNPMQTHKDLSADVAAVLAESGLANANGAAVEPTQGELLKAFLASAQPTDDERAERPESKRGQSGLLVAEFRRRLEAAGLKLTKVELDEILENKRALPESGYATKDGATATKRALGLTGEQTGELRYAGKALAKKLAPLAPVNAAGGEAVEAEDVPLLREIEVRLTDGTVKDTVTKLRETGERAAAKAQEDLPDLPEGTELIVPEAHSNGAVKKPAEVVAEAPAQEEPAARPFTPKHYDKDAAREARLQAAAAAPRDTRTKAERLKDQLAAARNLGVDNRSEEQRRADRLAAFKARNGNGKDGAER